MIGKKLLALREKSGLSQNEISKRLGIARTTYASYEQGAREPDIEMINKLAKFHGITGGELLGENKKETVNAFPESEYERMIAEIEEEFKLNLRDDPIVLQASRELIRRLAEMKRSGRQI